MIIEESEDSDNVKLHWKSPMFPMNDTSYIGKRIEDETISNYPFFNFNGRFLFNKLTSVILNVNNHISKRDNEDFFREGIEDITSFKIEFPSGALVSYAKAYRNEELLIEVPLAGKKLLNNKVEVFGQLTYLGTPLAYGFNMYFYNRGNKKKR